MSFKPAGYTSVAPYLIIADARATVRFLQATFDAELVQAIEGPDGRLRHAEVRIDDTIVMLADSAPGWPPVPSHVHIYVPDVDATFARALAAGGTEVQAPEQKDDPDRRGGVSDAGGTTWGVATRME
jgi:uncharacterized glyoxalase superfamily protein PhnB